ncbi:LysR substrate-binding domain-containing protein [Ruegeria sp. R13_0]|uniref:LysR substrate-binding domain-containing protein n=1 Tax=Ruegeria sp. R13_0 TaxID=2821099 RepID=UPI001FFDF23C|nr:LysR substrate-binding domain-containing protein [Ruegeria sp. R13_0]
MVFDAAAKHRSFTKAAEALNMHQPAVSSAIKNLEEALGVILFVRGHRSVELTTAGNRLYTDVSKALGDVEESVMAVRQMGQDDHVTLNSSTAFSHYWMMPRVVKLHEKHPDIDLRLQNSDREPNLDMENISLGIRLGDGKWPDCHSAKLADEVIMPVANPRVFTAAKNLKSIPNLMNERLIHLEEPIRERPTWSHWFAHHGIKDRVFVSGMRLNDYALVLQAAISGEGFAFGWEHIVRDMVRSGTLLAKHEWGWRTGNGIFLVWSKNKPLVKQAVQVRDWIISVSDYPDAPHFT